MLTSPQVELYIEQNDNNLFKTSKEDVLPPRLAFTIAAPTFICFEKGVL